MSNIYVILEHLDGEAMNYDYWRVILIYFLIMSSSLSVDTL